MANPTATVAEYCGVLARSRLLPPAEVAAVVAAWQADPAAPAGDIEAFRRFLVAHRYLTEYQAVMVGRGHADGYYVGGYVILDRVGRGRFAGVYKAVHASGQVVALKVLSSSKAKDPQVLARFRREGRLLTQLAHPNVVRAYQVGSAGGVHFIAMEYLEGETLDEVLTRRKQLPTPEATRLVRQALQGLQHLHERRFVHRDLKPANLMVTPAGGKPDTTLNSTVKVLDIGLGRELFADDADPDDMNLTAEGAVLGTPDYLAPEQARDARGADIRADVYSLGCVLYHLLAGRPPFSEKNVMATMVKHATEPIPPVTRYAPGVPPGLLVVLGKMLAKDPAGRYATPGEAADALGAFLPAGAPGAAGNATLPAFEQYLVDESAADPPEPPPPPPPAKQGTKPSISLPPPPPRPSAPSIQLPPRPSAASIQLPTRATVSALSPAVPESFPEIDVELVPLPNVGEIPAEDPRVVPVQPPRPLYDLDRRDFVMLAAGAGGVIAAIVGGFVAARTMENKVRGEQEEQQANQP